MLSVVCSYYRQHPCDLLCLIRTYCKLHISSREIKLPHYINTCMSVYIHPSMHTCASIHIYSRHHTCTSESNDLQYQGLATQEKTRSNSYTTKKADMRRCQRLKYELETNMYERTYL